MEKNFSKQDKLYSRLYNYSKKYIPYKWLGRIGLKNVNQENLTYIFTVYGTSAILSALAFLLTYTFNLYLDKIPFYMLYIVFIGMAD